MVTCSYALHCTNRPLHLNSMLLLGSLDCLHCWALWTELLEHSCAHNLDIVHMFLRAHIWEQTCWVIMRHHCSLLLATMLTVPLSHILENTVSSFTSWFQTYVPKIDPPAKLTPVGPRVSSSVSHMACNKGHAHVWLPSSSTSIRRLWATPQWEGQNPRYILVDVTQINHYVAMALDYLKAKQNCHMS